MDAAQREGANSAPGACGTICFSLRPEPAITALSPAAEGLFGLKEENKNWLQIVRRNPSLLLSEEGRYVIFAVGCVSIDPEEGNYVDLYALLSGLRAERKAAIDAVIRASVYSCPIDVREDDQLLALITCMDREDRRRVVAARRLREDETESELERIVKEMKKQ